ncbi:MAG: type II secretion system F family protein [Bdellovibrionaceae bacterium]|nr:type II secretion system F family protein [Pseudobdellovibrionaceae bacterium]
MPRYLYQAKMPNGQLTQGEMDAASDSEVRKKLQAMKFIPVRVSAVGKASTPIATLGLFQPRVNSKDLQIFTRQLATLVNAGIPVADALKILSEGLRSGLLKVAAGKVLFSIEAGRRLSDSLAQHPYAFDRLYCNMIQAGEEAGILDSILMRLSTYLEKSQKIKGQVKGALVYPAVIIVVAMLVISGILIFIIPKFQEVFSSVGKEPPALTMMVVGLSQMLVQKWYVFLLVLVGTPLAFISWVRTSDGKRIFDELLFNAPVFGEVVQKSSLARVTRTLSTLLSSGVGLLEAIEIAAKTSGNYVIERALLRSKESVTTGKPFATPLAKEKSIPQMVAQMIAIGEKSGTLDQMLGKIADFYEDEVEAAVKAMTSLIEPLLMVVLGGIIAFLVIAMYLPIFNMGDVVGA